MNTFYGKCHRKTPKMNTFLKLSQKKAKSHHIFKNVTEKSHRKTPKLNTKIKCHRKTPQKNTFTKTSPFCDTEKLQK